MSWLQILASGLAGGLGGYAEGQKYKQEQAERKRREEQEQAWRQQQFGLQQDAADFSRAATTWGMHSPDEDLTTNPALEDYKRFGFGLKTVAPKAAPMVSEGFALPSLPSFALSAPPVDAAAKYDPTSAEGADAPATPSMQQVDAKPVTVGTPSFGMGAPGKVTRTLTPQEAQQKAGFETRAQAMRSLLPQVAPQYRTLLQESIKALESGVEPEVSSAAVMQMIQGSQPKPPAVSAQPDFDFILSFEIANNKPFDPATATTAEKQKALDHQNKTKLAGQRTSASAQDVGGLSTRDRVDYQQALNKLNNRPEVRDYREVGRYIGALDAAMSEARKGNPDSLIAVDQALINSFNKMLDPTSVVREAEYARTASDQSLVNRLKGYLGPDGKLVLGGAGLTLQDREAMARMAKAFVQAAEKKSAAAMQEVADYYDPIITASGKSIGEILREAWKRTSDRSGGSGTIAPARVKYDLNGNIISGGGQ